MTTDPNASDERTARTDEQRDEQSANANAGDDAKTAGSAADGTETADDGPEIVDGRTIEHLLTDHERDIAAATRRGPRPPRRSGRASICRGWSSDAATS